MISHALFFPALLFATLTASAARPNLHSAVEFNPSGTYEIEVGHKHVRGKSLKAFDGKWSGADGTIISEVATIEKIDGKKCYVRRQVWPMPHPGVSLNSELVLDAATLATVSFQREVVGLPKGATPGSDPVFARWEFDGPDFQLITRDPTGQQTQDGHLPGVMFEGSGLGLIIATLPLKEGYVARIPVAMTLGLGTELTTYTIQARVVGKQKFDGPKGKKLKAFVVETDWCEYEKTKVDYPGGADKSGGTYFVFPKPPKGIPHVARYQNDTTLIDLIVDQD